MKIEKRYAKSWPADVTRPADITIMDLSGPIVRDADLIRLVDAVNSELHQNRRKIALNLAGVTKIDVAGHGAIQQVLAATEREGGIMAVFNLQRLQSLLVTIALVSVFDCAGGTEKETIKYLADSYVRPYSRRGLGDSWLQECRAS